MAMPNSLRQLQGQPDGYHLVLSADQYAAIMEYTDLLKPEPEGE